MAKVTKKKAEAQAAPVAAPAPTPKIIAYKGFDKDFKCRDFQFEVGETYTQTGEIKACKNGFHACPSPLAVFEHYAPASNRFAIVEMSGATHAESEKIAAECITVVREVSLAEFIDCAITSAATNSESNTGNYSAASNTGKGGLAIATGSESRAMAGIDGAAIVLVQRNDDGDIIKVLTGIAGQNIAAGAWYTVSDAGELVEAQS